MERIPTGTYTKVKKTKILFKIMLALKKAIVMSS